MRMILLCLALCSTAYASNLSPKLHRFEWNTVYVLSYPALASLVQSVHTPEDAADLRAAARIQGNGDEVFTRVAGLIKDPAARERYESLFKVRDPVLGIIQDLPDLNPRYFDLLRGFIDRGLDADDLREVLFWAPNATDFEVGHMERLMTERFDRLEHLTIRELALLVTSLGRTAAEDALRFEREREELHRSHREWLRTTIEEHLNDRAKGIAQPQQREALERYLRSVARERLRPGLVPPRFDTYPYFNEVGPIGQWWDRLTVFLRRRLGPDRTPKVLADSLARDTDQWLANLRIDQKMNDESLANRYALRRSLTEFGGQPEVVSAFHRRADDLRITELELELKLADEVVAHAGTALEMRRAARNSGRLVRWGLRRPLTCEFDLSLYRAHEWEAETRRELDLLRRRHR